MNTFLRHANEYYGILDIFDDLYKRSQEDNMKGIDLYSIITSKNNILLAYRTIKSNTGSKTCGADGLTIEDYKIINEEQFINGIKNSFKNYKPHSVRRVMIPKSNGKQRPLGIPTMKDRLIQQCIKQVLEPICEAKFYNHSYGFRPNRSTHDAMARCNSLINKGKELHHIVDIDIKGFFDNVNHTKLMGQLYNIGVKDKRILAIIYKILKAPIKGEGIPTKGTPQGGILSPLLSNVVLNDLDWWVVSQWEELKTSHEYTQLNKYRALMKTNLKQIFIVRYADDFKIFTKSHKQAIRIYHAVKGYLKDRLKLDISKDKSKITNLRRNASEFLGFKIKAVKKKEKYVAHSYISDSKKAQIIEEGRRRIREIQKSPKTKIVLNYNSFVFGIHNYFKIATHVSKDYSEIAYRLSKTLYNRLKSIGKYGVPKNQNGTYKKFYKNKNKTFKIKGTYLFPLADIKWKHHPNFTQEKCNYNEQGRKLLETTYLSDMVTNEIRRLEYSINEHSSIEYTDNRISKYSMQKGNCAITGDFLLAENVHCHHIMPRHLGGTDEYKNLVIISDEIHRMIHAADKQTIERYMNNLQLDGKHLKKLNTYRKKCNLEVIKS